MKPCVKITNYIIPCISHQSCSSNGWWGGIFGQQPNGCLKNNFKSRILECIFNILIIKLFSNCVLFSPWWSHKSQNFLSDMALKKKIIRIKRTFKIFGPRKPLKPWKPQKPQKPWGLTARKGELVHNSFLTPISSTSHPSHSSPHPIPPITYPPPNSFPFPLNLPTCSFTLRY